MKDKKPTAEKKYAVFSGHVISKNDGERHFIDNLQLCRLYGVNPKECVMVNSKFRTSYCDQTYIDSLIPLTPQYDGDYSIPNSP